MRGLRQLFCLLRATWAGRDLLGLALIGGLLAYGALALALPIFPALARFEMRRFHLRTGSFASWASLQPYPWMYNFENWYLLSPIPLGDAALSPPGALRWRAINHHPARAITWFEGRAALALPGTRYLYLRTRYREQELLDCLRIDVLDPLGPAARPAVVAPCGDAP